ncbi:TPA: hypothetical protein DCX16_05090 [bacterium]|nr:hypothetical protein [bacterium]
MARIIRIIWLIVAIFDVCLGVSLVFFASTILLLGGFGYLNEPILVRALGIMDIFCGYLYWLMYKTSSKVLIETTAVLRLMMGILFLIEGIFLFANALSIIRFGFLITGFIDIGLFSIQIYYLKKCLN